MRRAKSRGMTLLEILVVVAILALIVVALLAYLWPTDDRRCRSEAERLAAWILGTRAESTMRDAPVRAELVFGAQTVTRQLGRESASLVDAGFEEDKKAEVFKTKAPVAFTLLRVPVLGDLATGTGWMVFSDHRTVGGVVVLELNEAVYSVVVGPGREGEISVVPGKAEVLKAGPGRAPNLFGAQGFTLDDSPFGPEGAPIAGGDTTPPMVNPPVVPPQDPPPEDPPPEDPPPTPPVDPPVDPPTDPDPEEEPEEDEPVPDAGPPPECRDLNNAQGLPPIPCPGRYETCIQEKCESQPTDVALRAVSIRVVQPAIAAQVIQPMFQQEMLSGRFNLSVKLIAPQTPGQPMSDFSAALVQARADPSGAFYPDPRLPSYVLYARREAACTGYSHCYTINVAKESPMLLYLRRDNGAVGECPYNILAVAGSLTINLNIPPGATMASQVTGAVTVVGLLTDKMAQNSKFMLPNQMERSLFDLMNEYGIPPDLDDNLDGTLESWNFQFECAASGVELPFVQANPGQDPCNN